MTQLADAPPSPIANRAARAIVLVGIVDLVIWVGTGIVIIVELAANQTSTLSNDARLLLFSAGHIFVGLIAALLCACASMTALWLFVAGGIVLLAIDIFEFAIRVFNFTETFPLISFFSFIYLAFNLAFAALAIAYIFFAWRAARRYFGFGLADSTYVTTRPSPAPLFDDDERKKTK